MKDTVVATVIGTVISAFVITFFKFIWKVFKKGCLFAKQRKRNKRLNAKVQNQKEKLRDIEWNNINHRIINIIDTFNVFERDWKSKIPNSRSRIEFINEYIDVLDENLTDEQRIKLTSIYSRVKELYEDLLKSNEISKKEKRYYVTIIEKLRED